MGRVDVTPVKFISFLYRKVVSVIRLVCGDFYHVLIDRCKAMTHAVMAHCDSLHPAFAKDSDMIGPSDGLINDPFLDSWKKKKVRLRKRLTPMTILKFSLTPGITNLGAFLAKPRSCGLGY